MTNPSEELNNLQEFENLLQRSKEVVLKAVSKLDKPSSLSGADFESIVFKSIMQAAQGTIFEGKLIPTVDRAFPDIVVDGFFGIEVKATKKDDWTSVGNSVLESSRFANVEKIYLFFGKLGGTPDIEFRNYEDCLRGISVTHYPRYQINMKLEEGKSIFREMGVEYETIRKSNDPVKPIRAFYKDKLKEGQGLWWIDDDLDNTATTSPIIKKLSDLSAEEKDNIKADIFAYFPEVFSASTKKYERIPVYLISAHSVLTPNLRDFFSASGQVEISHEGKHIRIPKIVSEALRLADKIKASLADKEKSDLELSWQKEMRSFQSPLQAWLEEVDHNIGDLGEGRKASQLFQDGSLPS